MKYRIIHEVDGNGREHYEVQFYEKHWYGNKWGNTKKYRNSGFDDYYVTARYKTLEEAKEVVNARNIIREVVTQGDTNVWTNAV